MLIWNRDGAIGIVTLSFLTYSLPLIASYYWLICVVDLKVWKGAFTVDGKNVMFDLIGEYGFLIASPLGRTKVWMLTFEFPRNVETSNRYMSESECEMCTERFNSPTPGFARAFVACSEFCKSFYRWCRIVWWWTCLPSALFSYWLTETFYATNITGSVNKLLASAGIHLLPCHHGQSSFSGHPCAAFILCWQTGIWATLDPCFAVDCLF